MFTRIATIEPQRLALGSWVLSASEPCAELKYPAGRWRL